MNKLGQKMQINKKITVLLIAFVFLAIQGCSSVRDATDWVPGVDSNEEIAKKRAAEKKQKRQRDKLSYENKAAYVVTGSQAEIDAQITVSIGQQYAQEEGIEAGEIGIEVHSGVVTLSGTIASQETAVKAIALAKQTSNVTRVISKLVIISVR